MNTNAFDGNSSIQTLEPTIRHLKLPSHRKKNGLIQYAYNNTSQNGEDGILKRIFDRIPLQENQTHRWCIDVGAWDGQHLSNTYSLLTKPNSEWKGLLIEADSLRFQQLECLYKETDHICIHANVSCDPYSVQSLPTLLDRYLLPNYTPINESNRNECCPIMKPLDIDLVSIDIDGCDYWVLNDLLSHAIHWNKESMTSIESRCCSYYYYYYSPLVICIEFNPTIPHEVVYIPPQNDAIRHGCSLSALFELLTGTTTRGEEFNMDTKHNYILVETTCYNAFFIRKDIFDCYITEKEVPHANDLEALHQVTMGTTLYQLYDGTIKLSGCKKLLWHRIPIEENKIQILKNQDERAFPFRPHH